MEYHTRSCYRDFRACRRPCFQQFHWYQRPPFQPLHQQPTVYMVHASVPAQFSARSLPRYHDRNFDNNVRKYFGKSKSNATKTRDKLRKQKFIESKTVCCGFPFSGLDNENFLNEITTQIESREMMLGSKLRTASETIKELQMENRSLRSTSEALQRRQASETNTNEIVDTGVRNNELSRLQEDLEFEKQRVVKYVSQNVERQREINDLRNKLEEVIRHSKFAFNHSKYLIEERNRLQENQHQKDLIDMFLKRCEKNEYGDKT